MSGVKVECYAGHKGEERPVRFTLGGRVLEVYEIEDRWYSPSSQYFRIRTYDRTVYVLRHDEEDDVWTVDAFRAGP